LWAIIGGYITVRLANKLTKEFVSLGDSLLLGISSGIVGGTCLNILTVLSFNDQENKRFLIATLKNNWPKDHPIPDFSNNLASIFFITCIFIILVTIAFSVLGGYLALLISKRKPNNMTKQ